MRSDALVLKEGLVWLLFFVERGGEKRVMSRERLEKGGTTLQLIEMKAGFENHTRYIINLH